MKKFKRSGFNNDYASASRVNDGWIFWFVYPIIALLSVHIGNDNTFKELLHIPRPLNPWGKYSIVYSALIFQVLKSIPINQFSSFSLIKTS
jgi:hypothetical protein